MSDLLQILKGTGARPRITFYSNGAPADLDSGVPTVTVTTPAGATSTPTASKVTDTTGIYEFTLTPQPEVIYLTITWAGAIGGVTQTRTTYVEVLGGSLFTLAALRDLKVAGGRPFESTTTYPDAMLLDTRTEVLEEFADILGFSPVSRFYREVVSVGFGGEVILKQLLVTRVLSVTAGGVAQVAANFFVDPGGRLLPVTSYAASPWAAYGYGVVVVEYAAGWERPKGDCSDVAMLRAAMKLDPGISSTASTVSTPDGSSYTFDAAGQVTRGGTTRHFGVPAIDAWLNRHSMAGLAVA
jgi:hypothetical protein